MKCKKIFSIILLAMFILVIAGCEENNTPTELANKRTPQALKHLKLLTAI